MRSSVTTLAFAVFLLASVSCTPADSLKKPSPSEIDRIVKEESDCQGGIKITGVRIVQTFFEQKQKTCKVRLKIDVTAGKTILVYIRRNRRDFLPNFILWKAGDKKTFGADAVLAFESNKKWHLKEYY
jgi:hypothetical protein